MFTHTGSFSDDCLWVGQVCGYQGSSDRGIECEEATGT